jgi:NAD(P)-dependent dehydrogenase (short-subunit alcohol dehydrogenase family)
VRTDVDWSVNGKTVLVTGAARGIGAESARQLARAGAKLALVGFEPEELAKVAADCGPEAIWFECDVTDTEALESAVAETVERFGGIDVCIANAGIAAGGPLRHSDLANYERVIEINLLGVVRTVNACLPHVLERRGYLLPIASVAAAMHAPGMGAYSASKAGVEAFSNCIRSELKHLGVDVGVGYFSWIDTEMVAGADRHPALNDLRSRLPGPFAKTYPVSAVGRAVLRGVEKRRRWVTVPGWVRLILLNRGWFWAFTEAGANRQVPELDARFEQDVLERGREAASGPVGAGGAAERERALNRS